MAPGVPERHRWQDRKGVAAGEVLEYLQLALVTGMCAASPTMSRVEETHAFQCQKGGVFRSGELSLCDRSDSTALANKETPMVDGREGEAGLVPSARGEGWAYPKAGRVIGDATW